MATKTIVVTVIGPDKPGLINQLSSTMATHEANWLESHMANLAGQFAGILQIEVATEKLESLVVALRVLDHSGLRTTIIENSSTYSAPAGRLLNLELLGQDHPGIVNEISEVLSEKNIGIEELETNTQSASMAGGTLFHAHARLLVPDSISTNELDRLLQTLSDSLLVDIEIEEDV